MKRSVLLVPVLLATVVSGQSPDRQQRMEELSRQAVAKGLAEPFQGITIDDRIAPGVFEIRSTGVSTEPVRLAAGEFIALLDDDQRDRTLFAADDPEWRKWMNQSFYVRQGTGFVEMSEEQRDAAFALMRASLSARGLQLTRDIMRLNHTLGELNGDNFRDFGEWLYWITIMGTPSPDEPWGWQLDGHHLVVNYFVLGDQVVMSPVFVGSEPVVAKSGKFSGVAILQDEQNEGLALLRSLNAAQRAAAILKHEKDGTNNLSEAFRDNIALRTEGIPASDLDEAQREHLMRLIGLFVGNMADGHAEVKMREVAEHIDDTWFAWIGETADDGVYYYRILSPVVLIEFDHQRPVNLRHLLPPVPNREHIHAVLRTPNGNDYGKDLLRQHYEQHAH